jgi:NADH-quinone oxidoreductase subunit N
MTLGAFGAIILLGSGERPVETVEDLAGLGRTQPIWALALAVCLFSLAGIPPLAGFWGKFELFAAAFSAATGPDGRLYWWLAVIGVINSAIGAYYYLKIVVGMYLRQPTGEDLHPRAAWPTALGVALCAGLSVAVGLVPGPVIRATHEAAMAAVDQPVPNAVFPEPRPHANTALGTVPAAPQR